MKHFLLRFTLAPDYLTAGPSSVPSIWRSPGPRRRGELLLGGALDPADEAVLLFVGKDASGAETFAAHDPTSPMASSPPGACARGGRWWAGRREPRTALMRAAGAERPPLR